MVILLSIIHVLVCLILILIVLLQSGKGADLAGAFGGGGSQTAFGARGTATFLSKLTTVAAIGLMLPAVRLSFSSSRRGGSCVMERAEAPVTKQSAPASTPDQKAPAASPTGSTQPGSNQP